MFRNILVSVDGSSHADAALDAAIDLAAAGNGRLTILSAVNDPPPWAFTATASAVGVQGLQRELRDEARQILRAASDRVPPDVPVTTVLAEQPIRPALMDRIRGGTHDL